MPTPSGYAEISCELKHSLLTRSAYVVFGVDPTATDPIAVCTAVINSFTSSSSAQGMLDNNVTLANVRASLGTDGGEDVVGVVYGGVVGSIAQTSAPPNTSLLVRKITARGGRRGRGRMYWPWACATSEVDEAGTVLAAKVTSAQTRMTTFLSNLNANQVPMVILHSPGLSVPGAPNVVTNLVVDPRIATQRRRVGRP